jgi:MFS family permease
VTTEAPEATAPEQPHRPVRGALSISFAVQGLTLAVLVTRIPAIQRQYDVGDLLLAAATAVVPIVAGLGSVAAEAAAKRVGSGRVLRVAQPFSLLALLPIGAGHSLAVLFAALAVYGLALGAVDATQNMQGVALQHRYGRSIMLGFHGCWSLGAILGALAAGASAHWHTSLTVLYAGPQILVVVVLVAGRWYLRAQAPAPTSAIPINGAPISGAPISGAPTDGAPTDGATRNASTQDGSTKDGAWRLLMPLCLGLTLAYIADSTVSNWSAVYLQRTLDSSDQLSTVPYAVYLATMLLGRLVGDLAVRRYGAERVLRAGALIAAAGFALVAAAPGPWAGVLAFGVLGTGLSVLVPQIFAATGRLFPGERERDAAVARLNIFNYVGVVVGSPLAGVVGAWSFRVAMVLPLVMMLAAAALAPRLTGAEGGRAVTAPSPVG